jgi:hypothetical protein
MVEQRDIELTPTKNRTTVERKSERELVVTRTFDGPARLVFEAWTRPELLKQWCVPKSTRCRPSTPELVRAAPVRGGTAAIQPSGLRQEKGSRTDARDPAGLRPLEPGDDRLRSRG